MVSKPPAKSGAGRLPSHLRQFFWDYEFSRLSWSADADLITGRILAAGDWEAVLWLRRKLANPDLRAWIEKRRGAGLSARQLRYWELILDLPHRLVNSWLADPRRQVWENRL
jgi:hypothetical protein